MPRYNTFRKFKFLLKNLLLAVLLFLLIQNIVFKGVEFFSSGRVAVIILLVWALSWETGRGMRYPLNFFLLFLPIPYVLAQFVLIGDFGQLSRFLHLMLYSFIGAWSVAKLSETPEKFLRILFVTSIIESLIIFFSFVSVDYRSWHQSSIVSSGNFDASYVYRAPGLSGAAGASLSVVQSMGVLSGWLILKLNYANIRKEKAKEGLLVMCGMVLVTLSCVVVGRTGLVLSLLFFLLGLIQLSHRHLLFTLCALAGVLGCAYISFELSTLLPNDFSMDYFGKWAFGFLIGNDPILQVLYEAGIPPLSLETFFGTGLISIAGGANPSGNDSGFIQTYYAIGIPMTVFFYAVYLFILIKGVNWVSGWQKLVMIGVFFLLEVKEPFLFKYVTMFVLMCLYLLFKPGIHVVCRGRAR